MMQTTAHLAYLEIWKGECPGLHFRCTFSKVFKIYHKFYFHIKYQYKTFLSPPEGAPPINTPLNTYSLVQLNTTYIYLQWHFVRWHFVQWHFVRIPFKTASRHLGFGPTDLQDHPWCRLGGLKCLVIFPIDLTYCFEDIENSIFLTFGLNFLTMPTFWGFYGVLILSSKPSKGIFLGLRYRSWKSVHPFLLQATTRKKRKGKGRYQII